MKSSGTIILTKKKTSRPDEEEKLLSFIDEPKQINYNLLTVTIAEIISCKLIMVFAAEGLTYSLHDISTNAMTTDGNSFRSFRFKICDDIDNNGNVIEVIGDSAYCKFSYKLSKVITLPEDAILLKKPS